MRFALSIFLLLIVACAPAAEYARPELLFEPQQALGALFVDSGAEISAYRIVVLDVRSNDREPVADLPLTVKRIDPAEWTNAFDDGQDAAEWSERIGDVINRPDTTVVVMDESVSPTAARIWWILKYWGVNKVRIFNGGTTALHRRREESNLGTLSASLRTREPIRFEAKPHPERLATLRQVLGVAQGQTSGVCLVDTRSDAEVAAGKIPTAEQAEWSRFVDPETGKMRSADELKELLDEVGFDPNEPAIAYCRSGGRASVVAFAMELMGGEKVANYHGSWNDWSSDPAAPVAKPAAPSER